MSTWYNFYLGYKKNGKFEAIGPYKKCKDGTFNLAPIFICSSSFSAGIYNKFSKISNEKEIGQTLNGIGEQDSVLSEAGESRCLYFLKYTDLSNLSSNRGFRAGYVSLSAVDAYEQNKASGMHDDFCDYEFDFISPFLYAQLDKEEQRKYIYYAWVDYYSLDYIAGRIFDMATEMLDINEFYENDKNNIYIYMDF